MTDNEIIKALEYCDGDNGCQDCPYQEKCGALDREIIDLINRQKAEIERLKSGCKKLVEKQNLYRENMQATREYQIEQAQAEAIKEFAERLRNKAKVRKINPNLNIYGIVLDDVTETEKEMVGDV